MQIKSRDFLAFLFGEHFRTLTIYKKLYAAVGLLFLACVLLFSVVSVLPQKGLEISKQNAAVVDSGMSAKETAAGPYVNEPKAEAKAPVSELPKRPLNGPVIQGFGWQEHPIYKDWRYHTGIDIGVSKEQDIQAIFSGKVTDVYIDTHYGLTVVIESGDYKILYGSLSAAAVVKDSYIKAGQLIGKTGQCRDEPKEHLHVAVKKGDNYIDPDSLF